MRASATAVISLLARVPTVAPALRYSAGLSNARATCTCSAGATSAAAARAALGRPASVALRTLSQMSSG